MDQIVINLSSIRKVFVMPKNNYSSSHLPLFPQYDTITAKIIVKVVIVIIVVLIVVIVVVVVVVAS